MDNIEELNEQQLGQIAEDDQELTTQMENFDFEIPEGTADAFQDMEAKINEVTKEEADREVQQLMEDDLELERAEAKGLPDGMGNPVERMENAPEDVQELRREAMEKMAELLDAKAEKSEKLQDGIDGYVDVEPQDGFLGALDFWAKRQGTEKDMFPAEVKEKPEEHSEGIDKLQEEYDELNERIRKALGRNG